MMALPRPDVTVNQSQNGDGHGVEVIISRDGKAKSYSGENYTSSGATAEVIKKIIADPYTAEWLPEK